MRKFNLQLAGSTYQIKKRQFRALINYEHLSGKPYYQIEGLNDTLIFMYAHILASESFDGEMSYKQFLESLDCDPEALAAFIEEMAKDNTLSGKKS